MPSQSLHNKVVFFLTLLISLGASVYNAQTGPKDTLKKLSVDTINIPPQNDESIDQVIKYTAMDSLVAMPLEGRALLYGKSKIEYGNMIMEAEYIEIDYNKNLVTAYGKKDSTGKNVGTPVFKDGSDNMEAEKIMYNLKTKKGKIFNALTHQGDLLVAGREIKKDSTNIIYMANMRCIPCQEEDARTVFRATKAKIIPNDKIVTGPMYLEIGGVPTPLGLPFGFFPNTKKKLNGILMPTFGNSPGQGFNLRQGGFYWGINDMTDMVIRGDIYANGSWALNATNNYRILYKSSGFTYFGYSLFNVGDRDIPTTFSKRKAFEIKWTHNQDNRNNPTVRFGANVNFVNNQNVNRLTAVNSGQFLQNTFLSNISFTKSYKLSSLSLNASHSQNSQTRQMTITFPAVTFNVNRFFPFKRENAVKQNVLDKIGVSYALLASNSLTGYDSTIFKSNFLDSMRYGIKQSVPISTNFNLFKYITVTPGLNLSSVSYMQSTTKDYSIDTTIVNTGSNGQKLESYASRITSRSNRDFVTGYDANFSTNLSTKVFFDFMFKKGRVNQVRYLLIPTLGHLYRPDFSEEKYGFFKTVQTSTTGAVSRYSIFEKGIYSGPAAGKQNALSIGLSNNLEAKIRQDTDTGVTFKKVSILQNVGVGTAYNFAADSLKMSDITLTGRTVLFKNININASSSFDPYVYNKASTQLNGNVDRFLIDEGKGAARFTNASISVNTAFSSNALEAARRLRKPPSVTNGAEIGAEPDLNPAEKQPWNVNVNYNLLLSRKGYDKVQPSHQLGITADMMPTRFWKVGITTGFDFNTQKLSYTSLAIYRDLKCWEANISWVPFGVNKSYRLTLNLKTAMLNEFKIPRQRQWYDNF